jgi:hypothetical protein
MIGVLRINASVLKLLKTLLQNVLYYTISFEINTVIKNCLFPTQFKFK